MREALWLIVMLKTTINTMNRSTLLTIIVAAFLSMAAYSQEATIALPMLNEPVSDFQLADQSGNPVKLSSFNGKNVMLIFPRGMVKKDYWCQICHYQYADLADLEKKQKIGEKYNLEVLFVLPYQPDTITKWIGMFPKQMEIIEGWKYPKDSSNLSEGAIKWAITARKLMPKSIHYTDQNIETPFPILSDFDRKVSTGFKLYKNEPDAPQNTPAIYIIDKEGTLRFKYLSQDTKDRPTFEYLFSFMEKLM
jgi:peroxiredoxin